MPIQFSQVVRTARGDAIETAIGPSPFLRLRTGAAPANCASPDTGTVVASMALPADWMANASGGTKGLSGTWQDLSADATGTAAHFRIYAADGTTAHIQGTVTASGGGGNIELDNPSLAAGQQVTITAFNLTEGNG